MTGQRPDTEQVVRDWLADSAPNNAPASLRAALEEATSRPASGVRSGPRVGRRTLLFATRLAAAAAIAAIAVSGIYLYGSNRGTSPIAPPSGLESTVPSGSAAASASGKTSPVPSTSPADTGWHTVDGVFPKLAANLDSVIQNPVFALSSGGFLAFVPDSSAASGGAQPRGDALAAPGPVVPTATPAPTTTRVFWSSDGANWSELPSLPGRNATVTAVSDTRGLIVAVGWTGAVPEETAMAWTLSDQRTWQAAVLPAPAGEHASGVADGPAGYVAWGYGNPSTDFWVSTDGANWRSVAASGLPANASVDELYSTPGGYATRGFLSDRAAVWKSSDGAHWTQAWTGPGPSGMEFYALGPIARATDGTYVSFGCACMGPGGPPAVPYDLVVWTSGNLTSWTQSARIPAPGWTSGFAAVPGGFVTAGAQPPDGMAGVEQWGPLKVWTSADGRTWKPLAGFEATGSIEVLSVVGDGTHAIVTYVDSSGGLHLLVGAGLSWA
jgi:hypothetical protein